MYESFYGLREKPFDLLPDPDYIYMTEGHSNAFLNLEYALCDNKGLVIITGEIGSGKTTLINFLLRKIDQSIRVGIINHTDLSPRELLKMICQEFELDVEGMDKVEMMEAFKGFLLAQFTLGKPVLLIIDEAQNLSYKTMEEVRMFSNLSSEKHHLIQIILVGQPELRSKMQRKVFEQLAQRVTIYCHLSSLKKNEAAHYIRHRLQVAGGENLDIFDQGALDTIYQYSRGIPRVINILCDAALVYGFADESKTIEKKLIETVVQERKKAGILFQRREEESKAESPPLAEGQGTPEELKKRIEVLEGRISLVEKKLVRTEKRINTLNHKGEKRDIILLGLSKKLKQNMLSRTYTAHRLNQLITKMEECEREVFVINKNPVPSQS
jgi:general secretion pathway protein A